jgi:fluoroacetyl-CoA thioesterase
MKDTLVPGLETRRRFTIDKPRTVDHLGEALRVYATPELVHDIEITCRDFLMEHADEGEDSVGIRVELDHTGATLLGMTVEIAAKVTAVDGRQVTFEVSAKDDVEPVANAIHKRFVVDKARLLGRLEAKAEKAKA